MLCFFLTPYQQLVCTFLHIIQNHREKRSPTIRSLVFIYILAALLLSSFFSSSRREQDGISTGQKETEQEPFKLQNPGTSVPQGSVWLPCGCDVFVRPSPVITIMSLERCMRAELMCIHVHLGRCEMSVFKCLEDLWKKRCPTW